MTYLAFSDSQQKKEDLIGTFIQTRTKAHDIIRRMLASLGDPYTRFLPPPEVTIPQFIYFFHIQS